MIFWIGFFFANVAIASFIAPIVIDGYRQWRSGIGLADLFGHVAGVSVFLIFTCLIWGVFFHV